MMDIKRAIKLLKQKSKEAVYIASLPYYNNNEYIPWRRNIEDILESTFGFSSTEYKRVADVHVETKGTRAVLQRAYVRLIHRIQLEVNSIIQKYERLGIEEEPATEAKLPKVPEDYKEKARKELELVLNGTPNMIIECIMNFVKTLNSQGYAYKSVPRTGDAPDYARWDKTYSARCDVLVARKDGDVKIGTIRLQLLPNERTLLGVQEPEHWDSPLGRFLGHLLGEFKRLGFIYFEKEKPPIGFRLSHKEKNDKTT